MSETVNLYDAKTHLSKLADRAAAGEEIVIAKAGKPKAKLVAYQPSRKKNRLGCGLIESGASASISLLNTPRPAR
jgi:prevent-host-death family protein